MHVRRLSLWTLAISSLISISSLICGIAVFLGQPCRAESQAPASATTATETNAAAATSPTQAMSPAELKQQRKEAAHRKRRIIMNNDGNDARTPPEEPRTVENFLSKRTTALAGTEVDSIFYCTGVFNLYHHHSTESEPRKHGDQRVVDWAWELGEKGPDSLTTMVDFGHKHKMEVFWSMRMNDTHDSADDALLCQWKREHPEYLLGKKENKSQLVSGGKRWSAVNYEIPECREKVFNILRDVATRYDVDGLELDFFRHPIYFKEQALGQPVTQEQRDLMTELVRRIRTMADEVAAKRGRPMLIAVRVPDSVEYSSEIGLDLVKWMQEDLIDLMSVSCYFQLNPWKTSVDLGHKYDVPVYPSLSEPRFRKSPESEKIRKTTECYRGRAIDAWNAGADGIYMFNYFNPKSQVWRDLGNPESLLTQDQIYPAGTTATNDCKAWLAGGLKWLKQPVPLPEKPEILAPGKQIAFSIPVAAAVAKKPNLKAKVTLRVLTDNIGRGLLIGGSINKTPLPSGIVGEAWIDYAVDPSTIRQGVNHIELTMPKNGDKVTVSDAAIEIRYTPIASK
jgi:hypothetical protein